MCCVQTERRVEVQTAVSSHDDCVGGGDTDSNVDAASSNTDCHAVSPIDNSLSVAVNGEILQSSDENSSNVCDSNVACPTELDIVTPSDTSSGEVTDQTHADSATADTTVQHVADSDSPVSPTTFDSGINDSQEIKVECSSTEHKGDVVCDSDAVGSARVLVEEVAASDSKPPAESSGSKEPNKSDDKGRPSRPDTMLSWSDVPHDATTTSKNKCAVQFENSVMFDLDVE